MRNKNANSTEQNRSRILSGYNIFYIKVEVNYFLKQEPTVQVLLVQFGIKKIASSNEFELSSDSKWTSLTDKQHYACLNVESEKKKQILK